MGTLAEIVVALAAVAALVLSIYNTRAQRRDAREQQERWQREEERWQREEERWRREKLPNLEVQSDSRGGYGLRVQIYSLRVVNSGGSPVEIRSLRMVLPDERRLPLPEANEDVKAYKWETEKPVGAGLPHVLQPGQSIRFATEKDGLDATLRRAGFTGWADYRIEVEDALGNTYSVSEWAMLGEPFTEP
jgi:hypothetical protein